jgi:hypothetical protein
MRDFSQIHVCRAHHLQSHAKSRANQVSMYWQADFLSEYPGKMVWGRIG